MSKLIFPSFAEKNSTDFHIILRAAEKLIQTSLNIASYNEKNIKREESRFPIFERKEQYLAKMMENAESKWIKKGKQINIIERVRDLMQIAVKKRTAVEKSLENIQQLMSKTETKVQMLELEIKKLEKIKIPGKSRQKKIQTKINNPQLYVPVNASVVHDTDKMIKKVQNAIKTIEAITKKINRAVEKNNAILQKFNDLISKAKYIVETY